MTNCNLILLSVIVLPWSDIRLGLKDFESTKPPKLEVIQISMRPYLGRCKLQSKGHGITCGEITHSCSQKKKEMLKIQLNLCISRLNNYPILQLHLSFWSTPLCTFKSVEKEWALIDLGGIERNHLFAIGSLITTSICFPFFSDQRFRPLFSI